VTIPDRRLRPLSSDPSVQFCKDYRCQWAQTQCLRRCRTRGVSRSGECRCQKRSVPAIRPRRSALGAPIHNRQRKKGAARTSSPLDASGVTEREHCSRHRQSARAQGPVSPPQLAASSGGQHGHDDTSDHPHHRAHCFRWRLVRPGTLVLEGCSDRQKPSRWAHQPGSRGGPGSLWSGKSPEQRGGVRETLRDRGLVVAARYTRHRS
jgi:hypothetical protein